jgi:hypothetical protein
MDSMSMSPGVQLKKSIKGKITHIAINLQKHPDIIPVLKEKGLIPKTPFEQEAENALTVDEMRNRIHQKIKDFYANRRNQPVDSSKD